MIRRQEGFSLAELLVVLALLIPFWASAMGLAANSLRAATRATRSAEAETAIATAVAILEAEVGELKPGVDLLLVETARLQLHAARGVGQWCRVDSAGVVVPTTAWAASRVPVPGRDSLLLERVATDTSGWRGAVRVGLSASPAAATCPSGSPAIRLPADLSLVFLPGFQAGPVVRTTEVVELTGYASGGETWLGLRHLGIAETVQPAAGPFRAGGITFEGLDVAGSTTSDPSQVRAVRVILFTPGTSLVRREVIIALRG